MICPNCKQSIEDGREFCPTCGVFLRLDEGEKTGIDPSVRLLKPSEIRRGKPRWVLRLAGAAAIIFGGVAFLFCLGLGLSFADGISKSSKELVVLLGFVGLIALTLLMLFGGVEKILKR